MIYLQLFIINLVIGLMYPPLYYLFLQVLGLSYIKTGAIVDTIGALQSVLFYYIGVQYALHRIRKSK